LFFCKFYFRNGLLFDYFTDSESKSKAWRGRSRLRPASIGQASSALQHNTDHDHKRRSSVTTVSRERRLQLQSTAAEDHHRHEQ
jgi:hypothetical protein